MLRRSWRRARGWVRRTASGEISWGGLRTFEPVDAHFGARRGQPVDRHYIESFLAEHAADIRGVVLETGHSEYTTLFGGSRVTRSMVLHAVPGNRRATIVGDITDAGLLAGESIDCIVLTQTLQYVFDLRTAIANLRRALRPGGTLLVTVPALTKSSRGDIAETGEYWRFTSGSLRRLLGAEFGEERTMVRAFGNLVTATAFLHGLAAEDLTAGELSRCDEEYELLVAGRAVRR